MPTYHPSFLLREDSSKRYKAEAWADLKKVMVSLIVALGPGDKIWTETEL